MANNFYHELVQHHPKLPAMIAVVEAKDIDEYFRQDPFIPPHWHRSIEMTYIEKATVELKIGNQESIIKDDFTFVNSGEVHSIRALSYNPQSRCIIVLISYDFILNQYPDFAYLTFDLHRHEDHQHLKEIFEKIAYYYQSNDHYHYLDIIACLYMLLSELLRNYQVIEHHIHKKYETQDKIKEVLNYIHNHYQEELTLEQMADIFHSSKEHFSRLFHQTIGIPFSHYLTNYRLYQSMNDLISSKMSIQDIARVHGFANVSSYIHCFKKTYQATPLQYRKNINKSQ